MLPRWRELLPELSAAVAAAEVDFFAAEWPEEPLPTLTPEVRARLGRVLDACTLGPGEMLAFDRIHGPETPFADHQPLRQLAAVRTTLTRIALAEGDIVRAEALAVAGLAQARAALTAQEGIIPLIHAAGVWASALNGVHALARSPALPVDFARRLLIVLQGDAGLAQVACARTLRGEYIYIYRVVVERLPQTNDPDVLLSSIGSLGMGPPETVPPGEPSLGLTKRVLLDVPATLAAYQADLAPYLAALEKSSRLPQGLFARSTAATLGAYQKELGAFYHYATTDEVLTHGQRAKARAAMEAVANPGGKLLACLLTPPWEVILGTALRREAQRSALCGLLAWRIHGRPAAWSELTDLLPTAPADPFSDGALRFETGERPRVWSVYLDGVDGGGVPVPDNLGQPPDLVWRF